LKKAVFGNAQKAVQYDSNGDSSDWMLHSHDIVAFNPEVGNDTTYGDQFYVPEAKISKVVSDFYPSVKFFMEMHKTQLTFTGQKKDGNSLKISLVNKGLATLFNAQWSLKLRGVKGQDLKISSVQLMLTDEERSTRRRLNKSSSHNMALKSQTADKSEYVFGMNGDLRRRFYLNFSVYTNKALPENLNWELLIRNSKGAELVKFQAKA